MVWVGTVGALDGVVAPGAVVAVVAVGLDDGDDAAYATAAMSVPAPARTPKIHHASPGLRRRMASAQLQV